MSQEITQENMKRLITFLKQNASLKVKQKIKYFAFSKDIAL